MAILVGIDEAGYGPILGPLVVSSVTVRLPEELLTACLWQILRRSVSRTAKGAAGRILINDSKKLHAGRGDYRRLQRGVLACLAASSAQPPELPATVGQLLKLLNASGIDDLAQCPWYSVDAETWPLDFNADDISTAAAALSAELQQNQAELPGMSTRPILVGRFNHMVAQANNKAIVLFSVVAALIDEAFRHYGRENLQIVVDKQSGRTHYRRLLQTMFGHLDMKILKEEDTISSYRLSGPAGAMRIHFLEKGDARQLPIALASMTSKYVRELFMEILNAYFKKLCPDITPTAGYYKDGRRFLADLRQHDLPTDRLRPDLLVRQR